MKNKITYLILFSLVLFSLALGACSAGSTNANKFPTGRFVNANFSQYEYEFNDDNTWTYYIGSLMGAKGTYRIEDNLWIEEGTDECPFEGAYQWTYDGENLAFTLNGEDNCSPRKDATDGSTFMLVK